MLICQALNISILHCTRFFMCLTGKHSIFMPFFHMEREYYSLKIAHSIFVSKFYKIKNTSF